MSVVHLVLTAFICWVGCVLTTTTQAWASHQNLGSNLVFSMNTDKAVYYYTEPVRVEVQWTNPTDHDWFNVTTCAYCYVTIDVIDVTTDPIQYLPVYSTKVRLTAQALPGHAQGVLGIAEIPAYKLKSGNKKYKIVLTVVLQLKRDGDNTTTYQAATNASRVITVR